MPLIALILNLGDVDAAEKLNLFYFDLGMKNRFFFGFGVKIDFWREKRRFFLLKKNRFFLDFWAEKPQNRQQVQNPKLTPKWSQNDLKMVPKRSQKIKKIKIF